MQGVISLSAMSDLFSGSEDRATYSISVVTFGAGVHVTMNFVPLYSGVFGRGSSVVVWSFSMCRRRSLLRSVWRRRPRERLPAG